jgi:3-methyl-2-oxobutanoate hydroxymethyltransferase
MTEARVTVPALRRMKQAGEKIAMMTAYDFAFGELLDACGLDVILVGDSVGTCVQGHATTLPVTLDQMVYHTGMVSRACRRALVVGDMPFGSYQSGPTQAVESACRLIKEGGAQAVKLEGGEAVADRIAALSSVDIPVMAHVGLTPQSVHRMGGYRVQGRTPSARERLLRDAQAVQEAGAFAVVLEGMPRELGAEITAALQIPTIGIGAGPGCDGQILVLHDALGLTGGHVPRFARQYVSLRDVIRKAATLYVEDVRNQKFPQEHESY